MFISVRLEELYADQRELLAGAVHSKYADVILHSTQRYRWVALFEWPHHCRVTLLEADGGAVSTRCNTVIGPSRLVEFVGSYAPRRLGSVMEAVNDSARQDRSAAAPPPCAESLLARFLPADQRDNVLGDLYEGFANVVSREGPKPARRWYWRQLAQSLWPYGTLTLSRWLGGLARRFSR